VSIHQGYAMPRRLTLRQVEAFKAVIENGSISSAAKMVHISQPAMSKLIAHFEADTGLKLFDRLKGRLAPTEQGMRLHEEVERLFAGVRQVESAADAIRREEQGRLAVGVMTALSGSFLQRATTCFLKDRRNVFCSIHSLTSPWAVDWLMARKLDVGLVSARIDNPYVSFEPLMEHPLVCIMPLDSPLKAKSHIEPQDLDQIPFVAADSDSYVGQLIEGMFEAHRIRPQIVLVANRALTVCEFVAAGVGVSLVHPLMVSGPEHRLAVRRFEPEILYSFQLCRLVKSRNSQLVEAFAQEVRTTAAQISRSILSES
jgi:DNA-binding transcriptional LysR family regulator